MYLSKNLTKTQTYLTSGRIQQLRPIGCWGACWSSGANRARNGRCLFAWTLEQRQQSNE